jgi:hypothetical protein
MACSRLILFDFVLARQPPESLSTTFLSAPGYAEYKEQRPAHAYHLADRAVVMPEVL